MKVARNVFVRKEATVLRLVSAQTNVLYPNLDADARKMDAVRQIVSVIPMEWNVYLEFVVELVQPLTTVVPINKSSKVKRKTLKLVFLKFQVQGSGYLQPSL